VPRSWLSSPDLKEQIIERYGDAYRDVPGTYTHQRDQLGLVHATLQAEPYVDDDFIMCDDIIHGNLDDITGRQQEERTDATLPLRKSPTTMRHGGGSRTRTTTAKSSKLCKSPIIHRATS
jgi:dTDP-glucose pyrophosphorylase